MHTPPQKVEPVTTLLVEGRSTRSIQRITGVDQNTITKILGLGRDRCQRSRRARDTRQLSEERPCCAATSQVPRTNLRRHARNYRLRCATTQATKSNRSKATECVWRMFPSWAVVSLPASTSQDAALMPLSSLRSRESESGSSRSAYPPSQSLRRSKKASTRAGHN